MGIFSFGAIKKNTNQASSTQDYDPTDNSISGHLVRDYYSVDITRITRAMGVPPKYNMDIDLQYTNEMGSGYGRVYSRTILSNPTIISILPGKVTMLPKFTDSDKTSFSNSILEASRGNSAIFYKVQQEISGKRKIGNESMKLFDFKQDTEEYAKYLNVLCRASAILMGIGDYKMPNTSVELKNFDYMYWRYRASYKNTKDSALRSIWTDFYKTLFTSGDFFSDKNYIHFFVNNQETNISENIQTDTGDSPLLSDAAQKLGTASASLYYYLQGDHKGGFFSSDVTKDLTDMISSLSGGDGDIFSMLGTGLLNGGQMVFPSMLSGVTYNKDIRCSMDFVSPYGDPVSIFLNCMVPALHLLAMSLPRQISDNMYTFPFVIRVYQPGMFNSQLAVISGIELNRGGDDMTAWTIDGLSTAWNVTITITPLYSQLMLTNSDHPLLFMRNEGLIEYLGNLCGADLKSSNVREKVDLFTAFCLNRVRDIPRSFARKMGDTLATKLRRFATLVG